jgi:hypothetical protein
VASRRTRVCAALVSLLLSEDRVALTTVQAALSSEAARNSLRGCCGADAALKATVDSILARVAPVAMATAVAQADAVLDADELAWSERFNYDDAEVAQFKRDWRDFEPDVDADGGLALDDFAAFVVLMFGSANAAALRDYRELPPEHKFSFLDFLRYMHAFESVSEDDDDDDSRTSDADADDDDGVGSSTDDGDDEFYVGDANSEPHALLRRFLAADADAVALMRELMPLDSDFDAVFAAGTVDLVRRRCAAVWQQELQTALAPVRAAQTAVGVFSIREEYRQLWVQIAPLLLPNVQAFGFDFNPRETNGMFSLRGSSSHAMLVKVNDAQWRYFPAKFIAMSDSDFVRFMHPPLLQLRRIARRLVAGTGARSDSSPLHMPRVDDESAASADAAQLVGELRPRAEDWQRLLPLDAALAARCAAGHVAADALAAMRRTATFPYGSARYHEFDLIACHAGDFASRSRTVQRWTSKFPPTIGALTRSMDSQQLLAVVRLRHGVMQSVVPEAERPERCRTLAFEECRVGAFAPAKTLSVFALIDGQWRVFPRAAFAAAANVVASSGDEDESVSDVDFVESDDETEHGGADDVYDERDNRRQQFLKTLVRGGAAHMSYAADAPVLGGVQRFDVESGVESAKADESWCAIQ